MATGRAILIAGHGPIGKQAFLWTISTGNDYIPLVRAVLGESISHIALWRKESDDHERS